MVAKDCARTVGRTIVRLARLRDRLGGLAFVVYENDSKDGTRAILERWSREVPDFRLISEELGPERLAEIATVRRIDGRPCRIQVLAYARERARETAIGEFGDFDCVLAIDADSLWFSASGVLRNAMRAASGELDCVSVNGMNKWLAYRDAYAFRNAEHPFGPEYLGEYWRAKVVPRIQKPMLGSALRPVYSAFGGAAIYSMAAFREGEYGALAGPEFADEQRRLDASRARPDEVGAASPIPVANTNFLAPVVCEHVCFHYSMRRAGFGRMFIDPSWRMLFPD